MQPVLCRRVLPLLILLSVSCSVTFAQPQGPDTLWTREHFLTSITFRNYGTVALPDGGYLMAGFYYIIGGEEGWTSYMRIDSMGNIVWWRPASDSTFGFHDAKFFSVGADSFASLIAHLDLGPFYTPGISLVNSDGREYWWHRYSVDNCGPDLVGCASGDGGLLIAFTSLDQQTHNYAIRWIRIHPDGAVLGEELISLVSYSLTLNSIIRTHDGGYAFSGTAYSTSGLRLVLLVKIDQQCELVFDREYHIDGDPYRVRVAELVDGTFILGGSDDLQLNGDRAFALHVSSVGDSLHFWTTIRSDGSTEVTEIVPSADGGYVLLSNDNYGPRLTRFSATDELLWRGTYATIEGNEVVHVLQDNQSRFLLFGPRDARRLNLIKTMPDPVLSAVPERPILYPTDLELTAYPNPFNPNTTISLNLPHTTRARLAVYDILGREVAVLQDGLLEAGEHAFAFDGTALPSGVYLARWQAGEAAGTQKMLLLK